jgi:L-Ala-D/L-Glu epimerase / N-acetyl-D-glutamate racemase
MTSFAPLRVLRLRVPLKVPYRLAFGPVEAFDTIVVECFSADGRVGLGEATVLTGYTDETIEESWVVACELAERLTTLGTAERRNCLDDLVSSRPFLATAFLTALEMAEDSPLLRVERDARVPILAIISASGEDAVPEEFERLYREGYRTFKVKVGFGVEKDLAQVRRVQAVASGRAAIRIDANQGYSATDGVAFVRALDPAGIELFEQPCAAGDWAAHLEVARAASVPLMLDESIYGLADIERAAELHAATYVKVKLMKLGTLAALATAVNRIRALGMKPVLGNGVACDLGCWMEACVAARHVDNAGEMNGFLKPRERLLADPLQVRDGTICLEPGFRPRLDRDRIEPFVLEAR